MKPRLIMAACCIVLMAAFSLFVASYEKLTYSRAVMQISNHATVIAGSLWTFEEKTPRIYLTLAAEANGYSRIVVQDGNELILMDLRGPKPTGWDALLLSLHLIPVYELSATVQYEGKKIGSVNASWPNRATYIYLYILFCILLVLPGIWLFLSLLEAKKTLESRVKQRTAELEKENNERRRTEEALRHSEERLRMALDGTSDGIWDWNLRTGQLYFSPRYYTMMGYDPDEFPASYEVWHRLVHPDDLAAAEKALRKTLETHTPYHVEFRFQAKNGEWRWILSRAKVTEADGAGKALRMTGSHADITERKRTEEALRQATLIVENSSAMLFRWKAEASWPVELVSQNVTLIGYTADELMNGSIAYSSLIHPDDRERIGQEVAAYAASGVDRYQQEYRIVTKEGQIRWVDDRTVVERDAEGRISHYQGIVVDITERRKAEDALRKYERIVSGSQDLMALINRNFVYEAANDSYASAYDKTRNEVVGQPVPRVVGEKAFREEIHPRLAQALAGQAIRYQREQSSSRLGPRFMDVTYYPMWNAAGQVEGVVVNLRDMTETRKLEEQLTQSQRIESIGTLAGGVAHEINNPINGIMNYAQLILDQLEKENPVTDYAQEILNETHRIARIVRNLLTFARNEKQAHSPAQLSDIAGAVLSLIQTVMRHDQIILQLNIPEDLPKIKCRSQQIQQVLMNLLTNARDSLNEKYPGYHPEKQLLVTARQISKQGRPYLRTTVEDRGMGIPLEIRDRIFDPFFTTKPKETGTGLGLSISYGIVRDHGGDLTVESEPGLYTRFHMNLPLDNGWSLSAK